MHDFRVGATNHAGMIMARRPFQLFVVGVLVHGTRFSVAYYDRAGAVFSDEYALDTDLDVLVRVIWRLTRNLDLPALGHDPTIQFAADTHYRDMVYPQFYVTVPKSPLSTGQSRSQDYPVTQSIIETRWKTAGPPLWVSNWSLFGRAAATWRVFDKDGVPCILQACWRYDNSSSDTHARRNVSGYHPALPLTSAGGDVVIIEDAHIRHISFRNVDESSSLALLSDVQFLILSHDLFTIPLKPLWDFDSPVEFIQGVRSVIDGECGYILGFG